MTQRDNDDRHFQARLKHKLDESAAALDEDTLRRLRKARYAALESARAHRKQGVLIGSITAASVAIVAMAFWFAMPADKYQAYGLEDIELLSSVEDLEFYEELEFYQWLAEEQITG